jgi:CheY-like chemotaxis protein
LTSAKKKILVVEDNTETQLIIKVNLRDSYNIEIADNAKSALELLKENEFDLVLLDVNLGNDLNGREVLDNIRGELNFHDLPVIIITAYDLKEDEKNLLIKSSCDYLEKPLDKNVLLESIDNCLQSSKD